MGKTILIVDDSFPTRYAIKTTLQNRFVCQGQCDSDPDIHVTEADSALTALEIIESAREKFDMIISDLNMPGMDGIAFVKELRKLANYKRTPFIMLTVEKQSDIIAEMKEAGADGWIGKPFEPDQLIKVVHSFIS